MFSSFFCFRALFVFFSSWISLSVYIVLPCHPLRLLSDMSVQMCVQIRERERKTIVDILLCVVSCHLHSVSRSLVLFFLSSSPGVQTNLV